MARSTILLQHARHWALGCLMLAFVACTGTKNFSKSERTLIYSGNAQDTMRVLQITDRADSLILRANSKDIKKIAGNASLQRLIKRMEATMHAEGGIGIAAPQVGINRNIFLFMRIDAPGTPVQVAINPRIVAGSEDLNCFIGDGCLSIPDVSGNSKRHSWIVVEYYDEHGLKKRERFEGYSRPRSFTGVIFQHEYDHLRGILFIDKLCE